VRQPVLVNVGRLAIELRLPRNWLKAEAQAGRIPCLRVGRLLRFDLAAVKRALAKRAATSFAVPCGREVEA
jgi:hypothetical protein